MKITKDLGLFRQTEEYEYTPTVEEMYFYYSGTHAGYNRDNPYAIKGMSVTKRRLTKVSDLLTECRLAKLNVLMRPINHHKEG